MKQIFIISLLFALVGCSSQEKKISENIKPFMTERFPDATYEVNKQVRLFQLKINDLGNLMDEENYEPIVTETFVAFYKAFVKSSNSAATATEFQILYENDSLTWKSDKHSLIKLGEISKDHVKP